MLNVEDMVQMTCKTREDRHSSSVAMIDSKTLSGIFVFDGNGMVDNPIIS